MRMKNKMKSTVQLLPNKHLENISKMFKKLYKDEQLSDVTLCCKDGSLKAHKLILATSSPYFHKIFTENNCDQPIILIMHGISYQLLHNLIELIYKGNVDVQPEVLNPLYELAGEFQLTGISGVLRDELEKQDNSSSATGSKSDANHGRDTRFKGLKRVAVDYEDFKRDTPAKKPTECAIDNSKSTSFSSEASVSERHSSQNQTDPGDPPKLSSWAKKLRKFKCNLCPSSFKRASHLSRHQLVHTGERPYTCEYCDKAFSRHDKLKHHVRKTHIPDYDYEYNNVEFPENNLATNSSPLPFVRDFPIKRKPMDPSLHVINDIISNVRSEALQEDSSSSSNQLKRPRGRPRKYPPIQKPLIKRGRGRPRLYPVKEGNTNNGENYDITNLPYGDLEYLTMSLQEHTPMIEPLVEIKTDIKDEQLADDGINVDHKIDEESNKPSVEAKEETQSEERISI